MNRLNRIFSQQTDQTVLVPAEFRALPYAETVVAFPSGPGTSPRRNAAPTGRPICRRADYYNKLSPAPATPREGLRPLGDHKFRRGVKTAYFFDTYEFTRWFSDRLLWNTVPGT